MQPYIESGTPCTRWKIGSSTFEVCPTRGARLLRWSMDLPSGPREVIYWPKDADWNKFEAVRGGNPILFPFMGRTYADGEKFAWKDEDGVRRPMPHHGFARDATFSVLESGPRHFVAELVPDARAQAAYPFAYSFRVRYDFSELRLRCTFELENRDAHRIPWCAGHHFYFTLPWHPGLDRRDYQLRLPARKHWRHAADGKLVPFAEMKGATEVDFEDPRLLDCIFTGLKSSEVRFGPRSGEEDIIVRVGEEPIPDAWATVVTWTESPESPFFCVEPWMGPPNSPVHGHGIRYVEPGVTDTFVTEVSLA